jgi:hypothetical protein
MRRPRVLRIARRKQALPEHRAAVRAYGPRVHAGCAQSHPISNILGQSLSCANPVRIDLIPDAAYRRAVAHALPARAFAVYLLK